MIFSLSVSPEAMQNHFFIYVVGCIWSVAYVNIGLLSVLLLLVLLWLFKLL